MPINEITLKRLRENSPTLTALQIEPGKKLTTADVQELVEAAKNNTYLKMLTLNGNYIDNEKAAILTALQNIDILTLGNNYISDDGAKTIVDSMPNLTSLGLESNHITDAGVPYLTKSKLSSLDLDDNKITSSAARLFLENTYLTDLRLDPRYIDPSLLQEIADHIEKNKKLPEEKSHTSNENLSVTGINTTLFSPGINLPESGNLSPTEHDKIKRTIEETLSRLPENTRIQFIQDLFEKYNSTNKINPSSQQTIVK